jgi:hypothetical protein
VSDNVIRPTFGLKAPVTAIGGDYEFFQRNPKRRYHIRPATADDLSLPGEPEQRPDQDDIIVMEKVLDPDSEWGFSFQNWVRSVQGEVLDTDEDIGNMLEQMRRSAQEWQSKPVEPWPFGVPPVLDRDIPGRRPVLLTPGEIKLLAWAIESEARLHDMRKGSCPAGLYDAIERACELRKMTIAE